MDTLVYVLKFVFVIFVVIPIVGFFIGQIIELKHRMTIEITSDESFLVFRFKEGFSKDIKIQKIYSLGFELFDFAPFVIPESGGIFRFPCRKRSFTSCRRSHIALLTQKSSYWSLTITKIKPISATK